MNAASSTAGPGNDMEVQDLIRHYPRLFHMAESGTWESIRRHGLLSTIAILDLFEITGEERQKIAERRRPKSVAITHREHGAAVIRDQIPMSESALEKCLEPGITPSQWYTTLNRRVFFWLSADRLNRLLGARAYRSKQHCVLTLDTAEMLRRHAQHVTLSPINSGSTIFKPQPRGAATFRSIADYPFEERRRGRHISNAVVELVADYSIPDVKDFVIRVEERNGPTVVDILYERGRR